MLITSSDIYPNRLFCIILTQSRFSYNLGKRVTDSDAQEKEKTDLVIKCTGLKVNSDAYSESLGV